MSFSTGRVTICTVETTIVDLVEAPEHAGGHGNVATVVGDLALDGVIDAATLTETAGHYATTIAHRAGYLIEHMTAEAGADPVDLEELAAMVAGNDYTSLDPATRAEGNRDERWRIIVNTAVEHDL